MKVTTKKEWFLKAILLTEDAVGIKYYIFQLHKFTCSCIRPTLISCSGMSQS